MSELNELLKNLVQKESKDTCVKATVNVSATNNITKEQKEIKSEQIFGERKLVSGKPAWVSVDYSASVNMGDYESAKVGVSVSAPVGLEFTEEVQADIRRQIKTCQDMCQDILGKEIAQLRSARDGR